MKLYGIPNCSTVRKARAWLDERDIGYEFHDYKRQGVPVPWLKKLIKLHGWETLINRNGPTWRKLSEAQRMAVRDAVSALAAMQENSSLIKRPLVERDGQFLIGFDADEYAAFFGK